MTVYDPEIAPNSIATIYANEKHLVLLVPSCPVSGASITIQTLWNGVLYPKSVVFELNQGPNGPFVIDREKLGFSPALALTADGIAQPLQVILIGE